jgi:hypothetical protein
MQGACLEVGVLLLLLPAAVPECPAYLPNSSAAIASAILRNQHQRVSCQRGIPAARQMKTAFSYC